MRIDITGFRPARLGAMRIGFVTIAMLTGVAAPAGAQTAGGAKADTNKRMCRATVPTGSIMRTKTCHTGKQWAAIDAEVERASQNHANTNTVERSQGGAAVGLDSFGQNPR